MFSALASMVKDNWEWRRQICRLAVFDLIKKSRGAVLSWAWLVIKPAVYVFVFWFALSVGLRVGQESDPPFFLWLISGIIPWFFMSDMLSSGSDLFHRYSYLVNKIKFPLCGIPTIFGISTTIINASLIAILLAIYFLYGMPVDIYLLQIPLIIFILFVFFNAYSMLASLLSALSKDFANLIKTLVTPLFWLSGIIFDVSAMGIDWVETALLFNPITFFATAFRDALYYKVWFWGDPLFLGAFGVVFFITIVIMLVLFRRLHEEVPDAL